MKRFIIFALAIIVSAEEEASKHIPATIFGEDQYAFREFISGAFTKMLDKAEIKLPANVSVEMQSTIDKSLVLAYKDYFEYLHYNAYVQIEQIFLNFTDFLRSCELCEAKDIPEDNKLASIRDPYIYLVNHLEIEDAIVGSLNFAISKNFNKAGSKFGEIFSIMKLSGWENTANLDSSSILKDFLNEISQTSVGSCINAVSEITSSATQLLYDGLDVISGNIFAIAKLYVGYDNIQKKLIDIETNCTKESLSDIEKAFTNVTTESIGINLYLNKDIIEADLKNIFTSNPKNFNYIKAFGKLVKILLKENTNSIADVKSMAIKDMKNNQENLACFDDLNDWAEDWIKFMNEFSMFKEEINESISNYYIEAADIYKNCGVPGLLLYVFSPMELDLSSLNFVYDFS